MRGADDGRLVREKSNGYAIATILAKSISYLVVLESARRWDLPASAEMTDRSCRIGRKKSGHREVAAWFVRERRRRVGSDPTRERCLSEQAE